MDLSFPQLASNNYNQEVWDAIEVGFDVMLAAVVTVKAQREARVRDQKALSFLHQGVDEPNFDKIAEPRNAKTAWELLQKAYQSADERRKEEEEKKRIDKEREEKEKELLFNSYRVAATREDEENDADEDESDEDDEDKDANQESCVCDEPLASEVVESTSNLAEEKDDYGYDDDGLRSLFVEEMDEIENDGAMKKAWDVASKEDTVNEIEDLAVRQLEVENAEIRAEMEASKLSASESVTTCFEVGKRERSVLKVDVAESVNDEHVDEEVEKSAVQEEPDEEEPEEDPGEEEALVEPGDEEFQDDDNQGHEEVEDVAETSVVAE
ncbi:hypothetical protein Droror1_Dr00026805, partial [Drosera rotundifolia]